MLEIDALDLAFATEAGPRTILHDVSLSIAPGEILGVVGESGSGKSVTALAVMRLVGPQGRITAGSIRLDGSDLTALDDRAIQAVRGRDIAMIFQEPMTSLNPLLRIGFQIAETLHAHLPLSRAAAAARVAELLEEVGLPPGRAADYPHQLSGGQRQRVMIAMAMACRPRLLIADEPTTALDVTIQAQILSLMKRLRAEHRSAILLITHDMGVIAQMADRVCVMLAGQIVETAPVRRLLADPAHPYTRLLLASVPSTTRRQARLPTIAGQMPDRPVAGCRFRLRCPIAVPRCAAEAPPMEAWQTDHAVRCFRPGELAA